MIEESKQLATDTLAELARQEEQLLRITDDVQTVRENLKYAGKQLRSIARRMAGGERAAVPVRLLILVLCRCGVQGVLSGVADCRHHHHHYRGRSAKEHHQCHLHLCLHDAGDDGGSGAASGTDLKVVCLQVFF